MKLFRTTHGFYLFNANGYYSLANTDWDALIARDDLREHLESLTNKLDLAAGPGESEILPPIGSQEVWAAGVTYYRSRDARMHESKDAGGGSFYDRVYAAERPELFFKATPHRVVGPAERSLSVTMRSVRARAGTCSVHLTRRKNCWLHYR